MFSEYKRMGLPAGPLAEPMIMWRRGAGKHHTKASCQSGLSPVSVAPWDVSGKEACALCCKLLHLPHFDHRAALSNARDAMSRAEAVTKQLAGRGGPRRDPVGSWRDRNDLTRDLGQLLYETSELAAQRRTPVFTDWYRDTLLPRQRAALADLQEVLPMFAAADWDVRYAVAGTFGLGSHNPLPIDIHVPADLRFRGVQPSSFREGLLWEWFRTVGTPNRDALADASVQSMSPVTRECETVRAVAYACADWLIAEYEHERAASPLLALVAASSYNQNAAHWPKFAAALLSQAQHRQSLESDLGTLVVLSGGVLDLLTPSKGVAKLAVTVFGPVTEDDSPAVFHSAALLHASGGRDLSYAPNALDAARAAHCATPAA